MTSGYLNNKNAQKGDAKKNKVVNLRVTKEIKERWKQKAAQEGLSLSAWIETVLNNHCSESGT